MGDWDKSLVQGLNLQPVISGPLSQTTEPLTWLPSSSLHFYKAKRDQHKWVTGIRV